MKIHERHIWAAKKLEVQPSDKILEIGCGPGITARLVAEKLRTGELHLLDHSEKSIRQAVKKTKVYVKKGIIKPIIGAFGDIELLSPHYDKIYCFNVRLLIEDNPRELVLVNQLIGNDGLFFLFFQPPHHTAENMSEASKKNLEKNRFEVIHSERKQMSPGPSICLVAKSQGHQQISL